MIDFSKDIDPDVAALCLPLTDNSKQIEHNKTAHDIHTDRDLADRNNVAGNKAFSTDRKMTVGVEQRADADKKYDKAFSFGSYHSDSTDNDFSKG